MQAAFTSERYEAMMSFLKYDGEVLIKPSLTLERVPHAIHRAKLLRLLYDYATALGISVTLGQSVSEYFEKPDGLGAGVVTTKGERFEADLVVAADGVGTQSWKLIQGSQTQARSSGFAIYRTAFPTKVAHQDPLVAEQFPVLEGVDDCRMWLAPKGHGVTLVSKDITTWLLTHKDSSTAAESWSKRVSAPDVLREVAASGIKWDPGFMRLIAQSPENSVVDWKLLWRDPVSNWVSEQGRVVQLGDAAHVFLPTSTNGGTQACEDGISLAACLALAGKNNIALATRVHNALRADRVSCCQRGGFRNREKWHHTDFEKAREHPEDIGEMIGRWVQEHEAEQYVFDNWSKCVNAVVTGKKFENTNIPPGYRCRPWTVDELAAQGPGIAQDEGDWS